MKHPDIIDYFSRIQARLTASLPSKLRSFISEHTLDQKRGCLVVGPRGIGKTTFLLKEAAKQKILYLSVDNPIIAQTTLSELAEIAFGVGYVGIVFDEVHYAQDWSKHIKSIYDNFPGKKIWISDSCSLILRESSADLTRRFPKLSIPFLSFREYLDLKYNISLKNFDPFNASVNEFKKALDTTNILSCFNEYKKEGMRPIFLEGDYSEKLLAIIEKTIFFDVPFFVPRIQENHLRLMNAIIGYLALSPIPTLSIDSLAGEWSVGKEKLYQLLEVLEHVGLIHIVRFEKDFKAYSKGAKIFFADPSLYSALSGNIGNIREALVVMFFRQRQKEIFASKNEQQGDFVVDKMRLEVGGRNKAQKGSDFVIRDETDMPGAKSLPLWSLGMMF